MEAAFRFLFFSTIFVFQTIPVRSAVTCNPNSCDPTRGPVVRFPFWLKDRQPDACGAGNHGFELDCNDLNQTILKLPQSGEFIVGYIDYSGQSLYLEDPRGCLARRTMNFSTGGSPFRKGSLSEFEYYRCLNSSTADDSASGSYAKLPCRLTDEASDNFTFVATMWNSPTPAQCQKIATVSAPLTMKYSPFVRRQWWSTEEPVLLELTWREPVACGRCELGGEICQPFEVESGREVGCSRSSKTGSAGGLPTSAKYGLTIGVGLPGVICVIGLACYACGLVRTSRRQQQRRGSGLPTTTTTATLSYETSPIAGLDRPTIESYPMTVLGASRRLPKPSDSTCPICLCEYEAKDALRSIPECNHYFHARCVDEWLKLNGTCPICRNSPASSTTGTPCSSASSQTSEET